MNAIGIETKQSPARVPLAVAIVLFTLAGCAPQAPRVEPEDAWPAWFPLGVYREIAARGHDVFSVESSQSIVVVEVRRGGSLAQLGHDHVVAGHNVRGFVAPDDTRCDAYVKLDELVVDEQPLRDAAGFTSPIPEAAIAATRVNMLSRVLNVDEHPFAAISLRSVEDGRPLKVAVTLNGVTRDVSAFATIDRGSDELSATGQFALSQSDFGITPLSILGGAIQVQDELQIRFVIRAARASTPPARRTSIARAR